MTDFRTKNELKTTLYHSVIQTLMSGEMNKKGQLSL